VLVALYSDRLAHRRQLAALVDFEHALCPSPATTVSTPGGCCALYTAAAAISSGRYADLMRLGRVFAEFDAQGRFLPGAQPEADAG